MLLINLEKTTRTKKNHNLVSQKKKIEPNRRKTLKKLRPRWFLILELWVVKVRGCEPRQRFFRGLCFLCSFFNTYEGVLYYRLSFLPD